MKTKQYNGLVHKKKFGGGVRLGTRELSCGTVVDAYFVADQTTRTILASFIQDLPFKQNPAIPDHELQCVREAYAARYHRDSASTEPADQDEPTENSDAEEVEIE